MARIKGDILATANYEVNIPLPLDARQIIPNDALLADSKWWAAKANNDDPGQPPLFYSGMIVAAQDTGRIYVWQGGTKRITEDTVINRKTDWKQQTLTKDFFEYPLSLNEETDVISIGEDVDNYKYNTYASGTSSSPVKLTGKYISNSDDNHSGGILIENDGIVVGNYLGNDSSFVLSNQNGKISQGIYIPTQNFVDTTAEATRTLLIKNKYDILLKSGSSNNTDVRMAIGNTGINVAAKDEFDLDAVRYVQNSSFVEVNMTGAGHVYVGNSPTNIDAASKVAVYGGTILLYTDTGSANLSINKNTGWVARAANYKLTSLGELQLDSSGRIGINKYNNGEGDISIYNSSGNIYSEARNGSIITKATYDYEVDAQGTGTINLAKGFQLTAGKTAGYNIEFESVKGDIKMQSFYNITIDALTTGISSPTNVVKILTAENQSYAAVSVARANEPNEFNIALNGRKDNYLQVKNNGIDINSSTAGINMSSAGRIIMTAANDGVVNITSAKGSMRLATNGESSENTSIDIFTHGGHITIAPGWFNRSNDQKGYVFNDNEYNAINLASNKIMLWHDKETDETNPIGQVEFTKPVKDKPGVLTWTGEKLTWNYEERTKVVSTNMVTAKTDSDKTWDMQYLKIAELRLPLRTKNSTGNNNSDYIGKTNGYQGDRADFRSCVIAISNRMHSGVYAIDCNTAYHGAATRTIGGQTRHQHVSMTIHEFARTKSLGFGDGNAAPIQIIGVVSFKNYSTDFSGKDISYSAALTGSGTTPPYAIFSIYAKCMSSDVSWDVLTKSESSLYKVDYIDDTQAGLWQIYNKENAVILKEETAEGLLNARDLRKSPITEDNETSDTQQTYYIAADYYKTMNFHVDPASNMEIEAEVGTVDNGTVKYFAYDGKDYIWQSFNMASAEITSTNTTNGIAYVIGKNERAAGATDDTEKLEKIFSSKYVYYDYFGNMHARAFYASSDKRWKDSIKPIRYINEQNVPEPKQFKWQDTGQQSYGFVAQELEQQGYPELVSTDENGFKRVDYNAALSLTVGKLLDRIKQQDEQIKELQRELTAIKEKLG